MGVTAGFDVAHESSLAEAFIVGRFPYKKKAAGEMVPCGFSRSGRYQLRRNTNWTMRLEFSWTPVMR